MSWLTVILALVACGSPSAEAPTEVATNAEAPVQPPASASAAAAWKHFGAPFTVDSALEATSVFAAPEAHAEGPVRLRGELTQVCQKMGCWAVVRGGEGRAMRITMKEHAFGIDKDTLGHECDVEGELVRKAVDPERLDHYASEGATDHPEAGKSEAWELVATAVSTRPR